MSLLAKVFFPTLARRERQGLAGGLGLLIGGALLVSGVFHGLVTTNFESQAHDGYLQLARSLAQGQGYRFSENGPLVLFRPPAYVALLLPMVLMPAAWQPVLVILLNSVLFWGAGCLVYLVTRDLFSPAVARLAVLLLWCNGNILWCLKNPMSWILQIFAMAALAYAFWRVARSAQPAVSALGLGAVAGAAILTHGAFLVIFAVLAASTGLGIAWSKAWGKIIPWGLACAMAGLIVLPWTWRNYVVSGRFIPVVEGAGQAYFMGNAIAGLPPLDPATPPPPHLFIYSDDIAALEMAGLDKSLASGCLYGGYPGVDTEQKLDRAMLQDLRRQPLWLIPKFIYNGLQLFFPALHYVWRSPVYRPASPISTIVLYDWAISLWNLAGWIFAGWGWRSLASRNQRLGYLGLLGGIAAYMVPYMLLSSASIHAAYTFPAYALLMPLTAVGLEQLVGRRRSAGAASSMMSGSNARPG